MTTTDCRVWLKAGKSLKTIFLTMRNSRDTGFKVQQS